MRRKKWEFRSLAIAVVNAFGESMGGRKSGTYNNGYREISPEAMMERIGS